MDIWLHQIFPCQVGQSANVLSGRHLLRAIDKTHSAFPIFPDFPIFSSPGMKRQKTETTSTGVRNMTPEQAIRKTAEIFPFDDYMSPGSKLKGAYLNIAHTVLRHLKPGASILDVGCGPCDKTAVLQFLGFNCFGWDDLQDDWHKGPGNKEKILNFTRRCGIDFRLADNGDLPFEEESFDMVMLHDVLEHLHDSPRTLMNRLMLLCKPEGFLFVTVPNAANIRKRVDVLLGRTSLPRFEDYYWYPDRWRGHVREYVRISVKVATCFGFKVATPGSVATLVWLGWVSGFFPSRV